MPIASDTGQLIGPEQTLPEVADDVDRPAFFTELLPAAFRVENTIGSAIARRDLDLSGPSEDYDPFEGIEGTVFEQYPRSLIGVGNPEEKERVRANLERELQDRETLGRANIGSAMAALVMAGAVDPLFMIPVGGQLSVAIKAGSVLRAGLLTARAGLLSASASETLLHGSQEIRTGQESALNIAGATMLAGVFGSSAAGLSKGLRAKILSDLRRDASTPVAGGSGDPGIPTITAAELKADTAGPKVNSSAATEEKLKGAFGAEKALSKLTPMMRLATSGAVSVRRAAQRIMSIPLRYEKNALGLPTSPTTGEVVGSIADRVEQHWTRYALLVERMEQDFIAMRLGAAAAKKGLRARRMLQVRTRDLFSRRDPLDNRALNWKEYVEEVSKTARRGDKHPVAEIQDAAKFAREMVIDPLKDLAIEAKLLPKDVTVTTAISYLTRVYNKKAIVQLTDVEGGSDFIRITKNWLHREHSEMSEETSTRMAEQIRDRILSHPDGRVPYEQVTFGSGSPFHKRTFLIEDELIEPFLENDFLLVMRDYLRTMAPDVEIAREFGGLTMKDMWKEIAAEYREKMNAAKTGQQRSKIEKARKSDEQDIIDTIDILRGTFATSSHPDSVFVRVGKAIRRSNILSFGGGFMLSSIPDGGSIIMANGITRTFADGVVPFVTNLHGFKMAAREVKLAGPGWETVLSRRAATMFDIGDETGRHSRFERGLERLTNTFLNITLLNPWNTAVKQFSGVITQTKILNAVRNLADGTISKGDLERLAASNIGKEDALRIAIQFAQHGESDGTLRIANTLAWDMTNDGRRAVEVFRQALKKEVDTIIVTPGAGQTPIWMNREYGRQIAQFKSFALASTQLIGLLRLQQRNLAALNGAMVATGLGMLVYKLKSMQAARETADPTTTEGRLQWVREGVDRSGIVGVLGDGINILEKVGVPIVPGGYRASRYSSRNIAAAIGGPTVGLVQSTSQLLRAVAQQDFSQADVKAGRRMLWYQNVFWASALYDEAERQLNDALGIPERRGSRTRR
jgi:hypothetical protein